MLLAAAFASLGFVQFPSDVEVGAMSAVAVDPKSGATYVLHRGPKPLLAFDKKGKFVRAWGEGLFKVAHGLRLDREGNVWTTDNGNHAIRKFSPEGKLLLSLEQGFRAPDDLVFARDGSIYVADAGNARIVKLSPDGKVAKSWGRKGKGEGEFALAHGIAIDPSDRIYVADRGNQRVQVFSPDGTFVAAWTGFGNPYGVLVVGRELLVSEGEKHQVIHLDLASGKVNKTWGGPEVLQLPHIMSASRGKLWVAEVNGKRVQVFRTK
jgi:DNA-binding beta-propeller fold protein YncE